MKLSEIINHVGDENLQVQNIMQSSPTVRKMKREASVVFYTDTAKGNDLMNQMMGREGKWTGLVVWIPTERLPVPSEQNTEVQPPCA